MTNPTKSRAGLLTALREDISVFRHGASRRWRENARELRRRLRRGEPESSEAATKPDTERKPGLLALLEDDIRQCRGALSAELHRLRDKIRLPLEGRRREGGVTTSAPPESLKGQDR